MIKNVQSLKDRSLIQLWKDYQSKHQYAQSIEYDDVVKAIRFISNEIN